MGKKKEPNLDISAEDKTGAAFKSAQDSMRNLASSAAVLEGPLGQVAGRINAIGAALGRMNPGMLAGGVGMAAFLVGLKTTAGAGGELEQQMFKLQAALDVTGRSGETNANELNDFARQLGEATLTSADAVRESAAALAAFKNVDTNQMQEILTLAQDMSAVFGGDLRQNTIKLARALDNPREGLSGLSRNILATSSAWRNMTADMFESGDKLTAQSRIIDAIKSKVGGIGAKEAGGLVGAIDTLGERWTRALENIGNTGPLKLATSAINGVSDALRNLNTWLEEDEKLQAQYNELIKPNISLLEQMGIATWRLRDAEKDATSAKIVLDAAFSNGVELKAVAGFTQLSDEYVRNALKLQNLYEKRQKLIELVGEEHPAIQKINEGYQAQLKFVENLIPGFEALYAAKKKNAELDPILAEKATKLIDKISNKTLSVQEQALRDMMELKGALSASGAEGIAKLKELETAYYAFVVKLNADENEKAQTRVDKMLQVEAARLERLKKLVIQEQNIRNFSEPGTLGVDPSEQENAKYQLELEALDRRMALLREKGLEEVEIKRITEEQKTQIDLAHNERRRQIAEDVAQRRYDLEQGVTQNAIGLLNELGKHSKLAAIASLAITKGLAIAQVLARTQEAAVLAYSSQLIPGDPTSYPRAAEAYTATQSLGQTSAALIAATGLVQGAGIAMGTPSGGGGGGGGYVGGGGQNIPTLQGTERRGPEITIINNGALTQAEFIDIVVPAIQQASDLDRLTVTINGDGTANIGAF